MPKRLSRSSLANAKGSASCDPARGGPHPVRLRDWGTAPSGIDAQLFNRSLTRQDAWGIRSHDAICFYAEDRRPGYQVTWEPSWRPEDEFGFDWWSQRQVEVLTAVQCQFFRMKGDLVADVVDIAFLHWVENGCPPHACLTLSQICEYRQIWPTAHALRAHATAMRDASGFRVHTPEISARLLEMDVARGGSRKSGSPSGADLLYVYRPGAFVGAALSQSGWYRASYSPRLLHLDPYRDWMAKRLGRYLRSEWRLNPRGYAEMSSQSGTPRYRTWGNHLTDAGIVPSTRDTHRVGEFIAGVYAAIECLSACGCLASPPEGMSTAHWISSMLTHPDDRELVAARGGRLAEFLARRVHLPAPPEIADRLLQAHATPARPTSQRGPRSPPENAEKSEC
jgi:hypothetical protein